GIGRFGAIVEGIRPSVAVCVARAERGARMLRAIGSAPSAPDDHRVAGPYRAALGSARRSSGISHGCPMTTGEREPGSIERIGVVENSGYVAAPDDHLAARPHRIRFDAWQRHARSIGNPLPRVGSRVIDPGG